MKVTTQYSCKFITETCNIQDQPLYPFYLIKTQSISVTSVIIKSTKECLQNFNLLQKFSFGRIIIITHYNRGKR